MKQERTPKEHWRLAEDVQACLKQRLLAHQNKGHWHEMDNATLADKLQEEVQELLVELGGQDYCRMVSEAIDVITVAAFCLDNAQRRVGEEMPEMTDADRLEAIKQRCKLDQWIWAELPGDKTTIGTFYVQDVSWLLADRQKLEDKLQQAEASSAHWQAACTEANRRNGELRKQVDDARTQIEALLGKLQRTFTV